MVVAVLYLSLKEKEHYRKIDPFSFDQLYYSEPDYYKLVVVFLYVSTLILLERMNYMFSH